jgi:protein required for attachment to host cells
MLRKKRWYAIANATEAAIYRDGPRTRFEFVERWRNPRARRKELELDSDRAGHVTHPATRRTGHSLGRARVHHSAQAERFARFLAGKLNSAQHSGEFDELVLVAGAQFLGMLRPLLTKEAQWKLVGEIPRDLHGEPPATLQSHIRAVLYSASA